MAHPRNETPDEQIDSTIIKLAEQYASCDRRSAEINDERKTIRDNAEKLGIPSKAFQHAVGMVKHMSEGERRDYTVGMNRVVRAIEGRAQELFPAEAERVRKRQENAGNKPRSEAELNSKTDNDKRSDPKAGGAAKAKAETSPPTPPDAPKLRVVGTGDEADVKSNAPPNPPGEQEAGEQALNEGLPETKKSQSQIAAEKRDAAKLN